KGHQLRVPEVWRSQTASGRGDRERTRTRCLEPGGVGPHQAVRTRRRGRWPGLFPRPGNGPFQHAGDVGVDDEVRQDELPVLIHPATEPSRHRDGQRRSAYTRRTVCVHGKAEVPSVLHYRPMGRPTKDRSGPATETLTLRLTAEDRALLDRL